MKKTKFILIFVLIFLIGWIANSVISSYAFTEIPFNGNSELASPADRIKEDQIIVNDNYIIIDVQGATWATYANTNSMDPLLDVGANGLELPVDNMNENDIQIGDIIVYETNGDLIVHRVIDKGFDKDGLYFITKGDNNSFEDPKVRFNQIKYILIGVIY